MDTLKNFNKDLSEIKELFHKYGKFDDANAKLDEISKYFAIYTYQIKYNIKDNRNLKSIIFYYDKDKKFPLINKLNEVFSELIKSEFFQNKNNNISIFGSSPSLNVELGDEIFAYNFIKLIVSAVDEILINNNNNFDLLNEAFGHYVRDNFRNHIEDAQYMTPLEVVKFMCEIALNDLKKEYKLISDFILCDPSCGVGSFLTEFYRINKQSNIIDNNILHLIGQDKVPRMVRLSKINLLLSNLDNFKIYNGNSISDNSDIDSYIGKVDLILTNPPFGAKFNSEELLKNCKIKFPILNDLILKNGNNFSSELLFLDRYISLLKPGGKVLAIVPDSVISSGSLNELFRFRLSNNRLIKIKSIIELPAVTFAQAGTRTKTSILYLERCNSNDLQKYIFIAKSDSIGFQVSTKKGTTIKHQDGINDLEIIKDNFNSIKYDKTIEDFIILNNTPSCVLVNNNYLKNYSWTPNHFSAQKFNAISYLQQNNNFELKKLDELVSFDTSIRKKEYVPKDSKCISVLHVYSDFLNFDEVLTYSPKYKGVLCKKGDLLFSKINPRIMRVIVVPDFKFPTTCSTEFEIINSKTKFSNYAIKLLLSLPFVQNQINSLTSGTSSSHNRIKTIDLKSILIPIPPKNSILSDTFFKLIEEYERSSEVFEIERLRIFQTKNTILNLFLNFND
jgi:hypothetical protein